MKKFTRIAFPLLTLGWMGFIFLFSAQTALESSAVSNSLTEWLINFFWEDFKKLPLPEQTEILGIARFIIRKCAHGALYFVLGLFASLSLSTYSSPPLLLRAFFSQVICSIYAASDEYHQLFVDGRSGELRDIIIDSVGSLLAVILVYSITAAAVKKHKKKGKSGQMKKKDLIKLNEELFIRNDRTLHALEELRQENKTLLAQLEELKLKLQEKEGPKEDEAPIVLPEKSVEKIMETDLPNETKYGAEIIGKIVVSAATHCNGLSASEGNAENKELINLILGRTEVAKAEILNIISSKADTEQKIALIDSEKAQAEDYFKSVIAQKG